MSLCKNTGWYGPIITMVMRGKDGNMLHSMHEIQKQGKKKMHKYDKTHSSHSDTTNSACIDTAHTGGITPPTTFKVKPFFLGKSHLVGLHVCL